MFKVWILVLTFHNVHTVTLIENIASGEECQRVGTLIKNDAYSEHSMKFQCIEVWKK